MIRNATCIVKPALAQNLVMRAPIRAMSYLYAEEGATLILQCVTELQEGSTLIVFPEGTRTPEDQSRPFHRGAANIAIQSGAPILPVYIHCHPPMLRKHQKWYQIPPSRAAYRFLVGDGIDPLRYSGSGERSRAARQLTRYLREYYDEQAWLHREDAGDAPYTAASH